ncbi:DNA damage-responsive transcriptional repressor RPH1 [Verticillium dahliae VdLs.17]|uniref:[histone H3]-trimethyl-L-lysine(9) demethylase n=1 Tax=Verticillium dahliae (strain VdLs.17 / ATCC MYA-4575 / FGSC 10137) TaxID=498257 RepID=G2XBE7_VERDV|nr:DNA damage-responsive transcriptional repressor RPH1 [Verticillium dahliae VdLs.17]EGY16315.1 DNA damage-responsive transcriptional repressor RPH1 [Verticillium dahliae VdLs.17]
MSTEAPSALASAPTQVSLAPEAAQTQTGCTNDVGNTDGHTQDRVANAEHDAPADHIECAKPTFLHSPPDSNNAAKSDGSDSELSELDDDAVDPADEPPKEDDIGQMEKIDHYGMQSGIVKIIPPEEWKNSLPELDDLVKQVRVREPIKQDIMGSGGTFRQVNILHQRSYNVPQWRKLCEQSEHQPPARRGERRANADKPRPATRTRAAASSAPKPRAAPAKKRGGKRGAKNSGKQKKDADDAETEDRPMTPVSPREDADEGKIKTEAVVDSVETGDAEEEEEEEAAPTVGRMGRMGGVRPSKGATQSVSARRKYSKREGSAKIDEEAFKDFDYRMDVSDYTPERCEELERAYWKTLTYAPPLYGADLMGTLFDESTDTWNLNKLPNLLDVLGSKVPGVNTAYLYLGMWKATFAWHLEDVDLYSINYLHFGAPKQWYSISQADAKRFEAAMKNIWPTDAKACDQFLRHKGYLISPQQLKQNYNITVNKCVSYPGEFVVTYPYGYHSGYNLGYNCAEAVNFALDSWLPMGKIAKRCQCPQAQDSVWIDVYDIERKLRGEELEYEEYTDDDGDEEEDEDMEEPESTNVPGSRAVKIKAPSRKRKRDAKDKDKKKVKKIRLRIKARAEPPCCLCPNDFASAELIPTNDGRKAHRMCAHYLPETYIETIDDKEVVCNVANVAKDRLDLKCLFCRSKRGACFQCSQKKCARAYHATCAAAAGVFVEEAEVSVWGEDGTEYKEQAFEFSCRFHRTKRDKKVDGDSLDDDERILNAAKAVKEGEICQLQYFKGDIFAGVVVENRKDERMLLVDILPNGARVEVEWKWLLVADPSDYHLPKASAKAIPMPTSQKAKQELNAKRAVDEVPRKDDTFVDGGFTWAEFHTCEPIHNKGQAKVDLDKDMQLWYYLGKTSTEAKAQYTESPTLQRHNPRSNYLDTLPKPAKPPKPISVTQRRPSQVPQRPSIPGLPRPSPLSTSSVPAPVQGPAQGPMPMPSLPNAVNVEKPYVYKPRKPIDGAWFKTQQFTNQQFALKMSNSPSPAPKGQQPGYGVDSRIAGQQYPQPSQYSQHRFIPSYAPAYNPQTATYGAQGNAPPNYGQPQQQQQQQQQRTWSTPSSMNQPSPYQSGQYNSQQRSQQGQQGTSYTDSNRPLQVHQYQPVVQQSSTPSQPAHVSPAQYAATQQIATNSQKQSQQQSQPYNAAQQQVQVQHLQQSPASFTADQAQTSLPTVQQPSRPPSNPSDHNGRINTTVPAVATNNNPFSSPNNPALRAQSQNVQYSVSSGPATGPSLAYAPHGAAQSHPQTSVLQHYHQQYLALGLSQPGENAQQSHPNRPGVVDYNNASRAVPSQTQFLHAHASSSGLPSNQTNRITASAAAPLANPISTDTHSATPRPELSSTSAPVGVPPHVTGFASSTTPAPMPSPGAVYTGTGASPGVPQYSQQAALNPAPQPPSNQESTSEIKPSKPQAPKVQYKIPEKVTPVPLPAMADKDSAPGSASNARGRQGTYKYTAFSYVQWCSRFHQLCTIAKCTEQDGSNFRDACTSSSSESSQLDTTNESQWSNVRPRLYRFTHQDGGFDSRLDPSAAFASAAYTQNGTPSRPPSQPTQVSNRAAVETPVPLPRLPVKVTPVPLPPQALQVLSAGNPVSKPSGYTGEAISETPILPPVRAPMATTQTSAEVDDMDRGRGVH